MFPRSIRLGLRAKLVLICLAWVCIPLLVVWGGGVYGELSRRATARQVTAIAEELNAGIVEGSLTAEELVLQAEWLRELGQQEQVMIRIVSQNGAVLHDTNPHKIRRWSGIRGWYHRAGDFFFGPSGPPDLRAFEETLPPESERPEIRAALAGNSASTTRSDATRRMHIDYRALPISNGGGAVYLTQMSRRSILALYDVRYQLLKLTLVLAFVAAAIGIWLGRRFVSPLVSMQQRIRAYVGHVERRSEADAEQLCLARTDELGELSRDFRELAERLQRRVNASAELAADLAHELKNPIAVVTTSAELLESAEPLSENRQARIAAAVADAAMHMNRSVDGMLRLARIEHTLASSRHVRIDLSSVLQETLGGYKTIAMSQKVEFDVSIGAGLGVMGVQEQLTVLVRNLVDNALLFCRGKVRVTLGREGTELVLVVEDDGPGVSEGNQAKLFHRFFTQRPESAPHGTGLGLTIAQTIARAHGGELKLGTNVALAGAAFALRLPAVKKVESVATEMPQ